MFRTLRKDNRTHYKRPLLDLLDPKALKNVLLELTLHVIIYSDACDGCCATSTHRCGRRWPLRFCSSAYQLSAWRHHREHCTARPHRCLSHAWVYDMTVFLNMSFFYVVSARLWIGCDQWPAANAWFEILLMSVYSKIRMTFVFRCTEFAGISMN